VPRAVRWGVRCTQGRAVRGVAGRAGGGVPPAVWAQAGLGRQGLRGRECSYLAPRVWLCSVPDGYAPPPPRGIPPWGTRTTGRLCG
jgi:hypothetical protein